MKVNCHKHFLGELLELIAYLKESEADTFLKTLDNFLTSKGYDGKKKEYKKGYKDGKREGQEDGYKAGHEEGYEVGKHDERQFWI